MVYIYSLTRLPSLKIYTIITWRLMSKNYNTVMSDGFSCFPSRMLPKCPPMPPRFRKILLWKVLWTHHRCPHYWTLPFHVSHLFWLINFLSEMNQHHWLLVNELSRQCFLLGLEDILSLLIIYWSSEFNPQRVTIFLWFPRVWGSSFYSPCEFSIFLFWLMLFIPVCLSPCPSC